MTEKTKKHTQFGKLREQGVAQNPQERKGTQEKPVKCPSYTCIMPVAAIFANAEIATVKHDRGGYEFRMCEHLYSVKLN